MQEVGRDRRRFLGEEDKAGGMEGKRGEYIPWKRVGIAALDALTVLEDKDVAGMEGMEEGTVAALKGTVAALKGTVAGIALV